MRLSSPPNPQPPPSTTTEAALAACRPLRPAYQYLDGASDYLHPVFTRHFAGHEFRSIFELGSRDGRDAVALQRALGGHIHAFECNPHALELCRQRLADEPAITLVPFAVWSESGRIPFFPVVETYCDDRPTPTRIGASSCFEAVEDYREQYRQTRIEVDAVRLDDYRREHGLGPVDLICLDLQGAALEALRGMPETLASCQFLIAELERRPLYRHQALFDQVARHLDEAGFELAEEVPRDDWFGDFLFVRR